MSAASPASSDPAVAALLEPWPAVGETGGALPPYPAIEAAAYEPAFAAALAEAEAEIAAIAHDPAPASFENTVVAMERSGRTLERVAAAFFNQVGADATDALQAIQRKVSPRLAEHRAATLTNPALYGRIADLWERRDALGLDPEAARVLMLYRRMFVRAGAELDAAGRARMSAIMARLAALGADFMANLLADEKAWSLTLDGPEDEAGLPDFLLEAAAGAAEARGEPGKRVVTLSRSLVEPFLTFSARRDLRERAFRAWAARGENGGDTDNRALIAETLALRAERAQLLGYESYAAFKLETEMAGAPDAVRALMERVWTAAERQAAAEAETLEALMAADGIEGPLEPWDWRYYAERQRKIAHDLDEAALKPHFSLENVRAAAFETATRLFGLEFERLEGVRAYHPDVAAWAVRRRGPDGALAPVGMFLADDFNRPSKRSGAWMSDFQSQSRLDGGVAPVVINVMNFAKPPAGKPALLTLDDARTLFHEFGHALHGLLSNVTYPLVSGTSVARDFVELPSQLYEHWLTTPEMLGAFARHVETGAPMSAALQAKLKAAETFNQGFATVEYAASALVDLALHEGAPPEDPSAAEAAALAALGMPRAIIPRHRAAHFAHLFAGDGYAAGYYSYMWSEVMDADAFEAFEETGDPFDPGVAEKLYTHVYAAGGAADPGELYVRFRGRTPGPEALLRRRGLDRAA